MARRKLINRNTRNVQRSKGTHYVTLPIDRQKVVVKKYSKGKIMIKDWFAKGRGNKK